MGGGLCKYCYQKERNRKNPEARRSNELKRIYGMTIAEFNAKLEAQGGKCAICGTTDPGGNSSGNQVSWPIDHNHKTKQNRGILCSKCNMMIGLLKESPEIIASAIEYLRKHE